MRIHPLPLLRGDGIGSGFMQIVFIRHAIAEERESFAKGGQEDAARPLTKDGRRKMRKAAAGLKHLVPGINLLATSALTRAIETGQIIVDEFGDLRMVQIAPLSPRKPPGALLDWLNALPPDSTVGLVGHEPHLSTFLGWLLTGLQESFVELKKGGAAMIEAQAPVTAGRATLLWVLKPSQLRGLR